MSYNLNDDVNESFEFEVDGHRYKMRYPLTQEAEEMQEKVQAAEGLKGDERKAALASLEEWMYGFISPVTDGAPPIAKVLKKQNVRVMRNFNNMIKAEFSQ